ncbi:TPA: hypothetical protein ACHDV4_001730 [Campylobacter jejuni]
MNESIYGSLEFYSKETQNTPSDKRDLGAFGDVAPYALGITEGFATKAFEKGIKSLDIDANSLFWKTMRYKITVVNFGILNFFLAKAEGKSNVRALTETSVGVGISILIDETPLSKYRDECSKLLNEAIKRLRSN